jgi:hypothetical protein
LPGGGNDGINGFIGTFDTSAGGGIGAFGLRHWFGTVVF